MDRTASLLVGDLSLSPCLIAPGTNHGSVHSLGAVEGQDQKKKKDLHFILNVPLKQLRRNCISFQRRHKCYRPIAHS